MRVIQINFFGGPGVMEGLNLPDPVPGAGEITIDVAYAAVGLVDVLIRRGDFPFELPLTPGLSISGYVRALGDGVTSLSVGQAVAAFTAPPRMGGYATIALVPAALAVPLDTADGSVSLADAAAIIVNGPTAYLALTALGGIKPSSAVVVHGATGALGSATVQIARHLGARPLIGTVANMAKRDSALAFGCTEVLLTSEDLPTRVRALTDQRGADVVVDPVGGPLRQASLRMLRPLGRLVAVGHASNEADVPVSPTDLWLGNQSILGLNIGALAVAEPDRFQEAARVVMALVARGAVHVEIDGTLPLDAAAQAHAQIEARSTIGTLLLRTDTR